MNEQFKLGKLQEMVTTIKEQQEPTQTQAQPAQESTIDFSVLKTLESKKAVN